MRRLIGSALKATGKHGGAPHHARDATDTIVGSSDLRGSVRIHDMPIDDLAGEIAARAPSWWPAMDAAVETLRDATGLVITSTRARRGDRAMATQAIYLQAVNDFTDLLHDASRGRGRPALRAARTMFEHHVAALDIDAELEHATRWLDHLPMAGVAEARLGLVERSLSGKTLLGYRHRMHKLQRDSEPLMRAAVARWNGAFQRQWHPTNLFDRARTHGLDSHYDFYRFASAPVHGSHGGIVGLTRQIQGEQVVRHGPALAISPYAVLYGTLSMRAVIEVAAPYVDAGLPESITALDSLQGAWQEYYIAMRELDEALWPTSPPPNVCALMVVEASGEGTWYDYQPESGRARRAEAPGATVFPEQDHPLNVLLSATHGEQVGICLYGAVITHPSDDTWVDASALLDEPPVGIRENGQVEIPVPPDEEA